MKPAPFEYFAPTSVSDALALLGRHGDGAKLLAGGQSLVPLMSMRLARPDAVIDLNRIRDLAYIGDAEGGLRIGAMTRQEAVERSSLVAARHPLLPEALALVGHPAIRNRGTIGGSLAHADPAAELPAVILALDGRMTATGPRGERTLPASVFFVDALTTALAADEVLTEIALPAPPRSAGTCFMEVARRHGDFALVGAAVIVAPAGDGTCGHVRIALCGVGGRPIRLEGAEAMIAGRRPDGALLEAVQARVSETLEAGGDLHASADYRREVAGVLVRRTLAVAWQRSRHA